MNVVANVGHPIKQPLLIKYKSVSKGVLRYFKAYCIIILVVSRTSLLSSTMCGGCRNVLDSSLSATVSSDSNSDSVDVALLFFFR